MINDHRDRDLILCARTPFFCICPLVDIIFSGNSRDHGSQHVLFGAELMNMRGMEKHATCACQYHVCCGLS